ncbi:hypothetical protein TWF594_002901 [Orbilia oligospora]|uniref:ubiquitinyl hydrolase 1 n=1 Tax=Orbilia oligospora TaxID=2813651 RepID=A0A7C8P2A0_ORBOL|nr:hypothetical protein TWF706_002372 [Orbilia oligospora]KAF3082431.1 hypothetical protein TWF103_003313 [Orbilia oligospora]KAF3122054.1 hypothetical protein TWF594_002901 [Orbilia oligospora]KAF3127445.1 hypothetical protein TWF703_009912 [Orbilia oligospora]
MSDLSDYQNLRRNHPGWCTIESEPAIFNQILRDAGVTNTRVIELYSLDESILDEPEYALLPVSNFPGAYVDLAQ